MVVIEHERLQPPTVEESKILGGGPYRCNAARPEVRVNGRPLQNSAVLQVYQTMGGRQLDRATIAMRLTEPLADTAILPGVEEVSIEAEVELPAGVGGGKVARKVYFWGFVSGTAQIDLTSQIVIMEAQQAPYHFGEYVKGQWEWNPLTGREQLLEADLVFNPQFDQVSDYGKRIHGLPNAMGVIRGNRDARKGVAPDPVYLFLDPLRTHTDTARKFNTGKEEKPNGKNADEGVHVNNDLRWTLPQVVHYLCWTCNGKEEYFKNPKLQELEEVIESESPEEDPAGPQPKPQPTSPTEPGGELNPEPAQPAGRKAKGDGRTIRDLRVPLGTYLPQALDMVLAPFGYSWKVDYATADERRIKIIKRGEGTEKVLQWQHHKEVDLDTAKTWTEAATLNVGAQSLINCADARGDFKLYEATWELKRGWGAGDDGLGDESLSSAAIMDNPSRWPAWRLWVLNEAGDYNNITRNGVKTKPYDFKAVFGVDTVPRRRRFHPCITLTQDRKPVGRGGFDVEWSIDNGQTWRPIEEVSNGAFDVLSGECGIYFSGNTPPKEIRMWSDKARVRITASVYSDERISARHDRNEESLQTENAAAYIEAGNRYFFRKVHSTSKYFTRVNKNEYASSQCDDSERAKQFASDYVKAWDQCDVSGTITIPYLDNPEQIAVGDVLTDIKGREIDLDAGSPYERRYPQVTGIQFDFQENRTHLAVETFRDTRYV